MSKDEPVCEVDEYGNQKWRLNGKLHREDGHAVEFAGGTTEWWLRGQLHREDGPAIEYGDGTTIWCLYGERCTPTPTQLAEWEWNKASELMRKELESLNE